MMMMMMMMMMIRPSVCLSVCMSHGAAALGAQLLYAIGTLLPAAGRPPQMCGLRTRPRTDVDPPRVELPSAGTYRFAGSGAITCSYFHYHRYHGSLMHTARENVGAT